MWVYGSGNDGPAPPSYDADIKNIVLYDHRLGRSGRHAVDFLDGYTGYLQVDGYRGYLDTKAILVGCGAHVRRKFIDAQKVQGSDEGGVRVALTYIKQLYRTEGLLKDSKATADERYAQRQFTSKGTLDAFKIWLDKTVLRKCAGQSH